MATSEILQITFAGIVAVSTIVYSVLTWSLVSETKRIREFQITPDVSIHFERAEADSSLIYIVFKNLGLGYAKNVKFQIIKDFNYYDDVNFHLKDKGIIKNGISNFYSNQYYKFFFTNLPENYNQKIKDNLVLKVFFQDINNKEYNKEIDLPLAELVGGSKTNPPDSNLGRIYYELSEIKKIIQKNN